MLNAPPESGLKNRKRNLEAITEHLYCIEFDLWSFGSENACEGGAVTDPVTEILLLPDCAVIGRSQANAPGNKPDVGMLGVHTAINQCYAYTCASSFLRLKMLCIVDVFVSETLARIFIIRSPPLTQKSGRVESHATRKL